MNNTKILVWSGLVALVVALVVFYFQPTPIQVVKEIIKEQLGAFPGPVIDSPFVSFNGVKYHFRSMGFTTGTTSLCSFEVPQYNIASTTLVSSGARFDAVATTAGRLRIYTGLGLNSTTTLLAGQTVGTLATGTTVVATTSLTSNDARMGANQRYVVFDFEGGSSPYLAIGGRSGECTAAWREY